MAVVPLAIIEVKSMANTSSNVSFGKPKATGAVYVAPAGTAVPTDATTALAAAYKSMGYISDDGLVNTIDVDTDDVHAWGGDLVLMGQTTFGETFTVNLLETNVDALGVYYGSGNVTNVGGVITVKQTSAALPNVVVVFELVMSGGRVKRIVVPNAQLVDRSGDITYTDGDPIMYPVKFQAYPDATGTTHTEYIAVVGS